jgi:hypothetical protein
VDLKPENSLNFAKIQNEMGIKGTYYFRMLPCSYNEVIIKQLIDLGHEIGYHYENMSLAQIKLTKSKCKIKNEEEYKNKLFELAIDDFEKNLEKLRKLYPVKTICMHGSPLSNIDNKRMWERINYKDFGIIAEPYNDVDYNDMLYLTDTGRRWNGDKVSVRDKVNSKYNYNFKHTQQIINFINNSELPDKIMFTFHPQRWNNHFFPWVKELINQNIKNQIKRVVINNK